MNLDNLKWIKYVNDQGGKDWAYEEEKLHNIFPLNWKADQIENAAKVQCGDLILLLQKGLVTHLVEVSDDKPCKGDDSEWGVVRQVKVMWIANLKDENCIPRQRDLFGYSHKGYAGGTVKKLEKLEDIPPTWHSLDIFRRHVAGLLRLTD
ncbi:MULTISPECIES: hypothetical protein [Cyanophyceae]|uniref:hypothetical protein n=1 Tax=Cyanophyceae TaxID=3028117 RepID=UPI00168490EF|nr:hypothetical protein [Trichocoleus sp. FACHB-40]MBD2007021.1 hypothetical protein [Trichocoleus sp. FACHB-40]